MKNFKRYPLIIVLVVFFMSMAQDNPGDKLIGVWEPSHKRAKVKIDKISGKYYGKIVWLKEPNDSNGKPKTDKNNPDESLRNTPLKGYRILKDFVYNAEDKEWKDGTIYDPQNGSTYNCVIKMTDANTLDIRGYIGVKTFGRTDVWKRLVIKR